jgi:hypothetical protein
MRVKGVVNINSTPYSFTITISVLLIIKLQSDLRYCTVQIFDLPLHSLIKGEKLYGRIRHGQYPITR